MNRPESFHRLPPHPLPCLNRPQPLPRQSRRVKHPMNRPESFHRLPHHPLHLFQLRHVRRHHHHFRPCLLKPHPLPDLFLYPFLLPSPFLRRQQPRPLCLRRQPRPSHQHQLRLHLLVHVSRKRQSYPPQSPSDQIHPSIPQSRAALPRRFHSYLFKLLCPPLPLPQGHKLFPRPASQFCRHLLHQPLPPRPQRLLAPYVHTPARHIRILLPDHFARPLHRRFLRT